MVLQNRALVEPYLSYGTDDYIHQILATKLSQVCGSQYKLYSPDVFG